MEDFKDLLGKLDLSKLHALSTEEKVDLFKFFFNSVCRGAEPQTSIPAYELQGHSKLIHNIDEEIYRLFQIRASLLNATGNVCSDPGNYRNLLGKCGKQSAEEILIDHISLLGLEYSTTTPRNGDCFFEAISDQLERQQSASDLRRNAVSFCRQNPIIQRNDGSVNLENFVEGGDLTSYLDKMSREGEWADHVMVIAMAFYLKTEILVVTSNPDASLDESMIWIHSGNTNNDVLILGHIYENHYQSLKPVEKQKVTEHISQENQIGRESEVTEHISQENQSGTESEGRRQPSIENIRMSPANFEEIVITQFYRCYNFRELQIGVEERINIRRRIQVCLKKQIIRENKKKIEKEKTTENDDRKLQPQATIHQKPKKKAVIDKRRSSANKTYKLFHVDSSEDASSPKEKLKSTSGKRGKVKITNEYNKTYHQDTKELLLKEGILSLDFDTSGWLLKNGHKLSHEEFISLINGLSLRRLTELKSGVRKEIVQNERTNIQNKILLAFKIVLGRIYSHMALEGEKNDIGQNKKNHLEATVEFAIYTAILDAIYHKKYKTCGIEEAVDIHALVTSLVCKRLDDLNDGI